MVLFLINGHGFGACSEKDLYILPPLKHVVHSLTWLSSLSVSITTNDQEVVAEVSNMSSDRNIQRAREGVNREVIETETPRKSE